MLTPRQSLGDNMNLRQLCRVALACTFSLVAAPAWAHHVMGGKLPSTFVEGLLSGLGHPVIGPEHLGFLIAIAVAVGASGLSLALPAVFVAAMAGGVGLKTAGVALPAAELMVAFSTILAGLLVARGRGLPQSGWAAMFAVAGVLHGYAFGESIIGAEAAPLGAYLAGLVLVQSALTIGIALAVRRAGAATFEVMPRLAGAAVFGIGIAALLAQLVPGA
jgi:urease accessory protein